MSEGNYVIKLECKDEETKNLLGDYFKTLKDDYHTPGIFEVERLKAVLESGLSCSIGESHDDSPGYLFLESVEADGLKLRLELNGGKGRLGKILDEVLMAQSLDQISSSYLWYYYDGGDLVSEFMSDEQGSWCKSSIGFDTSGSAWEKMDPSGSV